MIAPSIEGSLWKLKVGLTGSTYWRRNWVYADENQLLQWQSKTRPAVDKAGKEEEPKYFIDLSTCSIYESDIRKFAFTIDFSKPSAGGDSAIGIGALSRASSSALNHGKSLTFATDSVEEYEQWMAILGLSRVDTATGGSPGSPKARSELSASKNGDGYLPGIDERIPVVAQSAEDIIVDYFFLHYKLKIGEKEAPSNPALKDVKLKQLITKLDPTLNTSTVCALLAQDLGRATAAVSGGTGGVGYTSLSEFLRWWKANKSILTFVKGTENTSTNTGSTALSPEIDDRALHADLPFLSGRLGENAIHFAGFLDAQLQISKSARAVGDAGESQPVLRSKYLVRSRMPKIRHFESFQAPTIEPDAHGMIDWNELMQSSLEQSFMLQSCFRNDARDGIEAETSAALSELRGKEMMRMKSGVAGEKAERKLAEKEGVGLTLPAEYGRKLNTDEDTVHACLTHLAIKSAFYKAASEGVKCLISEYCLPETLRTMKTVRLKEEAADSTKRGAGRSSAADATAEDAFSSEAPLTAGDTDAPTTASGGAMKLALSFQVYMHRGIIYRVLASPATEAHRVLTEEDMIEISHADNFARKVSSNEIRAQHEVIGAVNELYMEHQWDETFKYEKKRLRDKLRKQAEELGEDMEEYDEEEGSDGQENAETDAKALLKPCTLFSTVVDCAGFRVLVVSPLCYTDEAGDGDISGKNHSPNHSPTHSPGRADGRNKSRRKPAVVAPQRRIWGADDVNTLVYGISSIEGLFLDALPSFTALQPALAKQLNLSLVPIECSVSTVMLRNYSLDIADAVVDSWVDVLSYDLQAHLGPDDRVYLMNFASLLPGDLPRKGSLDALTRVLRPEFLKFVGNPISSCDLRPSPFVKQASGDDNQSANLEYLKDTLSVRSDLYKAIIPQAALTLDSLSEMPVDSFGLTCFLHEHGLCCRHLGMLYALCRTPCVKQLLLSEAVGRSSKHALAQLLRNAARAGRVEALLADKRGRSKYSDFVEHMDSLQASRRELVVTFFNSVLGHGADTDLFWEGTLCPLLYQKFGIRLPRCERSVLFHYPQLLLAMQCHTGTRFRDIAFRRALGRPENPQPFRFQDLLRMDLPKVKLPRMKHTNLPGDLGNVEKAGEAYFLNGLYNEAITSFRMRLFVQKLLFAFPNSDNSWAIVSQVTSTVYKLALALFARGDFNEASAVVRGHIRCVDKYTPTTGRLLTLIMCVEFMAGRYDNARAYFDAAQEIYSYTLGPHHPVIGLHMCALGDLYYQTGTSLAQAKVLLMLAHAASKRSLGDTHIVNAFYESKLASIHLLQGEHEQATFLLSRSTNIFGDVLRDGSQHVDGRGNWRFEGELIDCFYNLMYCQWQTGSLDLALQSGLRCLELLNNSVYTKGISRDGDDKSRKQEEVLRVLPLKYISCLLVLSELFVAKNDTPSAFGVLEEAWVALKQHAMAASVAQRSDRSRQLGVMMSRLIQRILEVYMSSMNMQMRSLFESVAVEAIMGGHGANVPGMWSKGFQVVCDALWESKSPSDYFAAVMRGLQESEFWDDKVDIGLRSAGNAKTTEFGTKAAYAGAVMFEDELKNMDVREDEQAIERKQNRQVRFGLQAAIISRLLRHSDDELSEISRQFIH